MKTQGNLRATIDRLTPTPLETNSIARKVTGTLALTGAMKSVNTATNGRAALLRKQVAAILRRN